jgi:hypothetical protein
VTGGNSREGDFGKLLDDKTKNSDIDHVEAGAATIRLDSGYFLAYHDGWVFVNEGSFPYDVYRMRPDGSGKQKVMGLDNLSSGSFYLGGWLYFVSGSCGGPAALVAGCGRHVHHYALPCAS